MKTFVKLVLVFLLGLFFVFAPQAQAKTVNYGYAPVKLAPSPSPTPTPGPVDSFDLFWPIVAGKVEGDSLYSFKILKEKVRGFFIFSNLKKADYYTTLSEKRTVEAEKLLVEIKNVDNAKKTLDSAQSDRERVVVYLQKAADEGQNNSDSKNGFVSSLEKQRTLLTYLDTKADANGKSAIEDNLSKLNSILASYK